MAPPSTAAAPQTMRLPPLPHLRARRSALLLACALALAALPGVSALGAPLEPPDGRVYSGVSAATDDSYRSFLRVTGQDRVAIRTVFGGAGLTSVEWALADARRSGVVPVLSWKLFETEYHPTRPGASSRSIAEGDIDGYIASVADEVRATGGPVFMRPNWEMNGDWFPWSYIDDTGAARVANAPVHFRRSWQRVVEIFRGGSRQEIDARLAALGLPPLTVARDRLAPVPDIAWVWCLAHNSKQTHAQTPADYYPGDAYVDWVGVDWYGWGPEDQPGMQAGAAWGPHNADGIYERWSGSGAVVQKPFMLGEWGQRDVDRPRWTRDVIAWADARPEVKAQMYFSVRAQDGDSRLDRFPQAAALIRAWLDHPRWITDPAQVRDYGLSDGDRVGPAIDLGDPALDGVLSGPARIAPSVGDASGVARVRILLDGVQVADLTSAPWEWTLDPAGLADGAHEITVVAVDGAGNARSLARTVTTGPPPPAPPPAAGPPPAADAAAPTGEAGASPALTTLRRSERAGDRETPVVSAIQGIAAGQVLVTPVVVRPVVSGPAPVTRVVYVLNGKVAKRLRGERGYRLDPRRLRPGRHRLTVRVTRAGGRSASLTRTFRVPHAVGFRGR